MGLTVVESKTPGKFYVGLSDHTKVFIPSGCGDNDENEYREYLVIDADTEDAALNKVTLMLLANEYNTITDRLWAWR